MAPFIDFASLDLRGAFDFAIMIEEDAQLRYEELARHLGDDPGGAGAVFRAMVQTEGKHRTDLLDRRAQLFRGAPPRFEISVLDEGPERPEVDEDELPRTARAALEVALAAERRAHAFFVAALPHVADPEVRAFFARLAEEEVEHAALISERIAALGPGPAEPAPAPRAEAPPPSFPDREALAAALPRFDAATQAVARGVVVDGRGEREVAEALGVSRRTVSRKLARFLGVARQQLAGALAVAALAGCAGGLRERGSEGARELRQGEVARAVPDRSEPERQREDALAARVHEQVEARLRRHPPAVQRRVAAAVLEEARATGLDPLLVLALIHVESSWKPEVVSSAGAVGLMQLREPTMRREVERSGLPSADPRDPVANVRAGVRYLKRLVDAFDRLDVALMAYNAGPNRIRGHLRAGGIPERFHAYPKKVEGELRRLQAAIGGGAPGHSMALAETARRSGEG